MAFAPDSPVATEIKVSPNHGPRQSGAPDLLVLHYTGMPSAEEALRRLCCAGSEVSAHYFVFEDGRVVQCVPEARRAWHAGVAAWEGTTDINSRSIGIEIANPGHDHGYPDFPSQQISALIALCRDIVIRRAIAAHHVLAHSDVAPTRKQDPGEKFPWRLLHEGGVGLWVEPTPVGWPGPTLCRGSAGPAVTRLQSALQRYGYDLVASGAFDEATEQVVRAFQRHFRPALVDGRADASTRRTLAALLAARHLDMAEDL